MLLRQMQYFAAVVACNSFTEAAEQCYISQSAISQQIQALERELGVTLIHRENRRFSLTPAGEYFYSRCTGLLDEIADLRRETARIGGAEQVPLRIGYPRCYSGQELHQAVAEFSRVQPKVAISIVSGTHEELYDRLRSGAVDMILNDQRRAFSDEYVNIPLLQCGCCAEISAQHKFAGRERVTLESLTQLPCILIAPRDQQHAEQEYYQHALGFKGQFLFAGSLEEARLMAVGNRGFLPVDCIGTLPPVAESLRRIPIYRREMPLLRSYCLFWRRENAGPAIQQFADILRKSLHAK